MTTKDGIINSLKKALEELDYTSSLRLTLIQTIEYLQEEPVNESLEEAAGKYGANVTHPQYYTKNGAPVGIGGELSGAVIYGANWQKKQTIRKSCEWLRENIYQRVYKEGDSLGFPTAVFLEDFRKAMEE